MNYYENTRLEKVGALKKQMQAFQKKVDAKKITANESLPEMSTQIERQRSKTMLAGAGTRDEKIISG